MTGENKKSRVPIGKLIAWQTRPISLGAVTIITGYLAMFCTDILHMSPALVGAVIMASKIFDGVTDLFAGWLVDNTNTKLGKGRPYEFSLIGAWVCMYALFATNVEWSMTAKCIWIFIMYSLIFSVFTTMLNAAETPYIIRAFGDRIAVTKVTAYGGLLVTVGSMVVSVSFPIFVASMGTSAAGWQKLIAMYGVPLVLIGLMRFLFVKEKFVPENEEEKPEKINIKDILHVLVTNKYIWLLGIARMVPQMITGMAAGTYYFNVVVGDIKQYSVIQMVGMVAMIGILLFPTLMKKYSGMHLVGVFSAISFVGYLMMFFADANLPLLFAGATISGLASLPAAFMAPPIVMQIADYNEYNGMARMEATISSAVNFLIKIGQAVGSFVFLGMIELAGYNGNLAVQPDSAKFMIRVGYALIPAILMLVVIWACAAFRPLDRWTAEHTK